MTAFSFILDECSKSYSAVPFKLWVGETTQTDLNNGSIPASNLTEVFDGTIDLNAGDKDITFTFNQAYPYKGGNFVYLLYKAPSATNNDGVSFRGCYGYDKKHTGISRFDSNWYDDTDPLNPNETFGYSSQDMRPDIRVVFAPKAGVDAVNVEPSRTFTLNGDVLSCQSAVSVYAVNGMTIAKLTAGQSITLNRGLYIVLSAGGAERIAVR